MFGFFSGVGWGGVQGWWGEPVFFCLRTLVRLGDSLVVEVDGVVEPRVGRGRGHFTKALDARGICLKFLLAYS